MGKVGKSGTRPEERKETSGRESLKAALGRVPVVAAVDLGASKVACFIMRAWAPTFFRRPTFGWPSLPALAAPRPEAVAPVDPPRRRKREPGPVAALPVPAGAGESVGLLRAMPTG